MHYDWTAYRDAPTVTSTAARSLILRRNPRPVTRRLSLFGRMGIPARRSKTSSIKKPDIRGLFRDNQATYVRFFPGSLLPARERFPNGPLLRVIRLPVHDATAIHVDRLARDFRTARTAQEGNHGGNVLRSLPTPQRDDPPDLVSGPVII